MADNTANIKVNVTSTGDEALAKNAANTAASYKSVEKSLATAAATSKRISTPSSAARQAAAMENREYGVARGTAGATGAAGRDFANQAQGLGGLVHLYATFAANIFAATAAFTALSKAMDTTNMVKGLDQLGAASGRNLGYLSKQLAMISDGAISLRDSMEAVAKSSSAGLTNDQIMRLGSVAKNASQALGVSMPDALSRLSRGISKIEPELLDELGIFVRVDKAVQEYARTVGKTVGSLSDFERRQAYATAVLKEGEQKFSDISIASNSYAKLLASLSNVAQKAGEAINTVFGPIAKLLAENSALLTAALAGIVGILLNKAIPAMTQWRTNLAKTAQQASETAKNIENSFGERFVFRTLKDLKIPTLQADLEKTKAAATSAAKTFADTFSAAATRELTGKSKILQNYFSEATARPMDTRELKALQNRIEALNKSNIEADKAAAVMGSRLIEQQKTAVEFKEKQLTQTKELTKLQDIAQNKAETGVKKLGEEYQRMVIARRAVSKATSLNILSEVNVAAREGGILEGFQTLKEKVFGSQTLTTIDKFKTSIKGAFVIATSAVSTFLSAVAPWLQLIGLIAASLPIVYSYLTKTAKEAEETAKAIDALSSSTENLDRTLENISKKDPLSKLSLGSGIAKNTAIADLTAGMVTAIEKSFKELDKISSSSFDSFINLIKKAWGGDVQNVLNETLAESISKAFEALGNSSAEVTAKKELQNLLKYTGEDTAGIKKALDSFSGNKGAFLQITENADKLSKASKNAANNLTILREAQNAADKSLKDFLNSFLPQDNLSKFGQNVMDIAISLRNALNDPRTSTEALLAAFNKLEIFSPQVANSMASIGEEVRKTATEYKIAQSQIESYNKAILEQQKIVDSQKASPGNRVASSTWKEENEKVEAIRQGKTIEIKVKGDKELQELLEGKRKLEVEIIPDLGAKVEEYRKTVFNFTIDAFKQGADIVASRLNAEWAKASNVITSGFASLFGDTKAGIILREQAENRMLDAQASAIQTQLDLIKSNKSLEIQVQRTAIELEKANINKQLEPGNPALRSEQKREQLSTRSAELEKETALLQKREEYLNRANTLGSKGLMIELNSLKNKKTITKEDEITVALLQEGLKYAQNIEGALAQIAQVSGQKYINKLKAQLDLAKANTEEEKKRNDIELQSIKNAIDYLNIYSSITGPVSIIVQEELNRQKINEVLLTNKNKQLEIERDIAYYSKLISEFQSKAAAGDTTAQRAISDAKSYLNLLNAQKESLKINQQNQIAVQEANNAIALTNKLYEERNRLQEIANKEQEMYFAYVTQLNSVELALLDIKKSNNVIDESSYILIQNRLEQFKLSLEYAKNIADIEKQRTKELETQNKVVDQVLSRNTNIERPEDLNTVDAQMLKAAYAERERINSSYNVSIERATYLNKLNLEQLDIQKQLKLEAQRWEDVFKSIATSTLSLTALFGEMGTKIGGATEAFAKLAQIIEQNAKKQQEAEAELLKTKIANANRIDEGNPEAIKEVANAQEALDKQKKKSAKDEISAAAATAGAVKNLFKEKTAAYKAFAALEKGLHVARITWDAIEIASNAKKTLASIVNASEEEAASFGAMIVKGGEAVINAMKSGPPIVSFAMGAAMAAAVAAIISSVGGSGGPASPKGTGAMSAEQKQEVQGTGLTWNNEGKKVETGGGVFGDPSAKLDPIRKSLEVIEDRSIEGLPLFNEMVMLLQSIDRGINQTAKSLYTANLGKAFEGLNKSVAAFDIPVIGKLLGSIFGGGKEETLIDYGVVFGKTAGTTFMDLLEGRGIEQFATVQWKKSGGWFSSDKSGVDERLSGLNPKTLESFKKIFEYAFDTFDYLWKFFGRETSKLTEILSKIKIDEAIYLSIKDLKGEDLVTELNAVLGTILDDTTRSLFTFAEKYQQFGEDLFSTVIRIVDTNEKVIYALNNIGLDIESKLSDIVVKIPVGDVLAELTPIAEGIKTNGQTIAQSYTLTTVTIKEQSIAITEALVDMAGGMEEFAKGINFYMENFLTTEEKRDILTKNVTSEITRLSTTNKDYASTLDRAGISTLTSIDSFKKFVKAIDLTTTAGQELFTSFMNLAPSFYELYNAADGVESKLQELTAQLYALQGRTDEAIAIQRSKALNELGSAEEKTIQQQIWALEDEAKIRKLNIDLMNAEGRTFEALIAARKEELIPLTESERLIKNQIYAAQDLAKTQSLELRLLRLRGNATTALILEREKEIKTLSDIKDLSGQSDRDRQLEIWAMEDAAKIRALDIELLNAQGKSYEALLLQRAEELSKLTEAEQKIKNQIYAAQDLSKTQDLQIRLLQAEGKSHQALTLQRQKEIEALSKTDQAILKQIQNAEDLSKTQDLQIRLLQTEGKAHQALTLQRQKEIEALSETDQAILKRIQDEEDYQKTQSLGVSLLQAMGKSYEALLKQREKEILALSSTDAEIQNLIWAFEDFQKTQSLSVSLLNAMGKEYEAVQKQREIERQSLSATDKALQDLIWQLEDFRKTVDLNIRLGELTGNIDATRKASRDLEKQQYSDSDKLLLDQIYLQEDLARIRKLDIDLLNAQGKTYQALILSRKEELRTMTIAERQKQIEIYNAEDDIKTKNLQIQLMKVMGKEQQALTKQRELEVKALSDIDAQIQNAIWAFEDFQKTQGLTITLMQAMGNNYDALLKSRDIERQSLNDTDLALQNLIWQLEDFRKTVDLNLRLGELTGNIDAVRDARRGLERQQYSPDDQLLLDQIYAQENLAKTRKLDIALLNAQGKSFTALLLSRKEELKTMTIAERVLQTQVYNAEDDIKTKNLQIQLMKVMGKEQQALTEQRELELLALNDTDKAIQNMTWAFEDLQKSQGLGIELLRLSGKEYEAVQKGRQRELDALNDTDKALQDLIWQVEDFNKTVDLKIRFGELTGNIDNVIKAGRDRERRQYDPNSEAASLLENVYRAEDAIKLRKEEINLLNAQGKSYQALILSRKEELRTLTIAERLERIKAYNAEDELKTKNLQIQLMTAMGNAEGALIKQRELELLALNATDAKIQEAIWAFEDLQKTQDLLASLTRAMSGDYLATLKQRELERSSLTDTEAKIQDLIWAFEDFQKTVDLNIRLAELQGNADAVRNARRELELRQYSDLDQAILKQIYAQEDLIKAKEGEVELLEAQGRSYESLILSRKLELRTLTATEKALKKQVYAAQDMQKTLSLQTQLLRAMGKEQQAVSLEREMELKGLSATDAAIQSLIWQYEDAKNATDDLSQSLENITQSIGSSIESLENYRKSLIMGDLSPNTTADKYNLAKNDIMNLIQTIQTPATTDEQLQAQSNAVNQLQSTSDSFLQLSRLLYSSSGMYNADYNWIMSVLDSAIGSLSGQLSDAEKQLNATEKSNEYLASLDSKATALLNAVTQPVNYDDSSLMGSNQAIKVDNTDLINTASRLINTTNSALASLKVEAQKLLIEARYTNDYADALVNTPIDINLPPNLQNVIEQKLGSLDTTLTNLKTNAEELLLDVHYMRTFLEDTEVTTQPINIDNTDLITEAQTLLGTTNTYLNDLKKTANDLLTKSTSIANYTDPTITTAPIITQNATLMGLANTILSSINTHLFNLNSTASNIFTKINTGTTTTLPPVVTGPGGTTGLPPGVGANDIKVGAPYQSIAGTLDQLYMKPDGTYYFVPLNPDGTPKSMTATRTAEEQASGIGMVGDPMYYSSAATYSSPTSTASSSSDVYLSTIANNAEDTLDILDSIYQVSYSSTEMEEVLDTVFSKYESKIETILLGMTSTTVTLATNIITAIDTVGTSIQETVNNQITGLRSDTQKIETAIVANGNNNNKPLLEDMIFQLKALNDKVAQLEVTTAQVGLLNVEATNANADTIGGTLIEAATTQSYAKELQAKAAIV